MSTYPCEVAGMPVMQADIEMGCIGVWHINEVEAAASATYPAQGSLVTFEAFGVAFQCAVLRSTVIGGRVKMRLVGGKGKLSQEIPAGHWSRPSVETIVRDILSACGETLSTTVSSAVLAARLPQWKRNAVPASRALQMLCDNQGIVWRVLRDGTVWIGPESFPVAKTKHVLIDEDWSSGVIDFAPEAPDLLPGVTFLDQQIRHVVHRIRPGFLRSEASLSSPGDLLDRFLAGIRQEIQFSRSYPAEVVAQNADGTLQLMPDDLKTKGTGLNNVPIRSGLPGFKVTVAGGARGTVEFENGDPSLPALRDWELDASKVTQVEFEPGGVSAPACRVGDTVDAALPMGAPVTGLLGGVPFTGVITVTAPVKCVIVGPGNPNLLI